MADTCSIANQHCKAAANYDELTHAVCAHCEQSVCSGLGCSVVTRRHPQHKGKPARICAYCAAGHPEIAKLIDAGIYQGSGYPSTAKDIKYGLFRPPWIKPEWEFLDNPPHPMKQRWLKRDLDAYQAGILEAFEAHKRGKAAVPRTDQGFNDTAFYFAGMELALGVIAKGVLPPWLKRNVYEAK